MRMVNTFAGPGRKSACERDAVGIQDRIEDGFFECRRPNIGGEGLAVDCDIYAALGLVEDNLNTFCGCCSKGAGRQQSTGGQKRDGGKTMHTPCLPPSLVASSRQKSLFARS